MKLRLLFAVLLSAAFLPNCTCFHMIDSSTPVVVHAPSSLAFGTNIAADDLVSDLQKLGHTVTRTGASAPARCVKEEIHIIVSGHEDRRGDIAKPQGIEILSQTCEGGLRITVRGGSHLSAQWAVYALLEQLGIRYFHPEQTYYPDHANWAAVKTTRQEPSFQQRSMHVHRTHPVDLLAPKDASKVDMAKFQKHWIDWNVKLRQTELDGWDEQFVGTYAWDRGFPRGGGLNLLNSQQGGKPLLDPAHPEEDETRIAAAIDAQMVPVEGKPPVTSFGFQFNPSEFTVADEEQTVKRLTFIPNYMKENYPDVEVSTINHGTAQTPGDKYKVRFFDLSKFAPPDLGVSVHTLMFYDLERPAPVYGNENFQFLLNFIRDQAKVRRIEHYPESSWWLTFDLPVPLYLAPVTIEARYHDIQLLRDQLATDEKAKTGVVSHHTFSSGQEWGYWLIDWCIAKMAWDVTYTSDACYADFTNTFVNGGELLRVLKEVEQRQVIDMRDPELIRFLVGSDDATEAAWDAGIQFHPLPPQPKDVLGWDDAKVDALWTKSIVPLRQMARDYHDWATRVTAVLGQQNAQQSPWVREMRDGLEMFALRAEHAAAVYDTVLALRVALKMNDLSKVQGTYSGVEQAKRLTEQARTVVTARETEYRYPPELTIAGDEAGTPGSVENDTVYPYRYLSRVHRLFYWTRPDEQLDALFGAGLDVVKVSGRVFKQSKPLAVTILGQEGDALVTWGDGQSTTGNPIEAHAYAKQGLFNWVLDGRSGASLVHHEDQAAPVDRHFVFPRGSLQAVDPSGASILNGLMPGLEIGFGDDGAQFLVLGRIDGDEPLSTAGSLQKRSRAGSATAAENLTLELRTVGKVTVHQAIIEVTDGNGPTGRKLAIRGQMKSQEVIDLLVSVGGFDQEGARRIIKEVLGLDPLPEEIPFELGATGKELEE